MADLQSFLGDRSHVCGYGRAQQTANFFVLPALIPDIRAVYDVYFAAFGADADGRRLLEILFPAGFDSVEFREAHTAGTLAWWHNSPTQHTFKCVDASNGRVVGMALCDVLAQLSSEAECKRPDVGWLVGEQRVRAERLLGGLWEARQAIWGDRPYIYVHALAVHPEYQGRGAGSALMRTLTGLGDACSLPLYLESTRGAKRLYKKWGFRLIPAEQARVVHKADVLGTDKDVEVPLMVRMPSGLGMTSHGLYEKDGHCN